jgi:thioredoxin reductase (NADPH)
MVKGWYDMYDIVVIGAGTAGFSAAIYGLRAGKKVLVLEAETYGGQIVSTPEVENYPGIKSISGFDFANNIYEQAKALGAEIEYLKATKISSSDKCKVVHTDSKDIECKAVIIATGVKNRKLGLDKEEELIGRGVSYCAICDGAFYKGKIAGVVGGGNTALKDAEFLSSYCKKVYLVHRRDSFRGEQWLVNDLKKKDNVEFVLDSIVTGLNSDAKLTGITVKNVKTNQIAEITLDGLFIAVGQVPVNYIFAPEIELDEDGYVIAGENCHTNMDGVFAAGDCRTKSVRQLATATADGAVAAVAACEYLSKYVF